MSQPLADWLPNPKCCNTTNREHLCPKCKKALARGEKYAHDRATHNRRRKLTPMGLPNEYLTNVKATKQPETKQGLTVMRLPGETPTE
ncbi:MAG: hypothetical protein ACYTG0_10935 [Planctomycetota bacterium]|jgi:hypothetical protein